MERFFTPFLTALFFSVFALIGNIHMLAQSPVAHYAFDNDVTDASGNGYDLTPEGALTPAFEDDRMGNVTSALTVPGANGDFLSTAYTGISGSAVQSVTAWIKTAAAEVGIPSFPGAIMRVPKYSM